MPIKASPVTPQKRELLDSDPTGDTWVLIKPVTTRENLIRGEYLKNREMRFEGSRSIMAVQVNAYTLILEELWLTFAGGHVVLENKDGEQIELFTGEGQITRERFMEDVHKLPPEVIGEWIVHVRDVNRDWQYPF